MSPCLQTGKIPDCPGQFQCSLPWCPVAAEPWQLFPVHWQGRGLRTLTECDSRWDLPVLAQGASHVSGEEVPQLRGVKQRPGTVQTRV